MINVQHTKLEAADCGYHGGNQHAGKAQVDPSVLLEMLVGLAYQGKDIVVFRFIIESSSLKDFGPYV